MKSFMNVVLGCTLSVLGFSAAAHADVLANWTFETSVPATAGPHTAEAGIFAAGSMASGVHISGTTVYSNPVGNGSNESFSANMWAIGDYYQFTTSTVGFENLVISWDQTGSGSGPRDFVLQYSTDGTTFTDFANYVIPAPISWSSISPVPDTSYVQDLSTVAALNNITTVYLRMTVTSSVSINGGTIANAGTARVDNIVITGTAVPAPGALALLGLAGMVGRGRRR